MFRLIGRRDTRKEATSWHLDLGLGLVVVVVRGHVVDSRHPQTLVVYSSRLLDVFCARRPRGHYARYAHHLPTDRPTTTSDTPIVLFERATTTTLSDRIKAIRGDACRGSRCDLMPASGAKSRARRDKNFLVGSTIADGDSANEHIVSG